VGTPQPSEASMAASGAPVSALCAYREEPNMPVSSPGLQQAAPVGAAALGPRVPLAHALPHLFRGGGLLRRLAAARLDLRGATVVK
jgi:hypothetical protein